MTCQNHHIVDLQLMSFLSEINWQPEITETILSFSNFIVYTLIIFIQAKKLIPNQ